jgi:hypothetical protein
MLIPDHAPMLNRLVQTNKARAGGKHSKVRIAANHLFFRYRNVPDVTAVKATLLKNAMHSMAMFDTSISRTLCNGNLTLLLIWLRSLEPKKALSIATVYLHHALGLLVA